MDIGCCRGAWLAGRFLCRKTFAAPDLLMLPKLMLPKPVFESRWRWAVQ